MGCLLVTYDLNKPGQNYKDLHEAIKGLGSAWWHYLDSTWLVRTALSANQASDKLLPVIDKSDSLLVLNVSGDAYAGWLEQDAWNWIKENL
jgi:hypothetical protein